MFNYKGVGIVFLRKTIQECNKEPDLLDQLTPEERTLYLETFEVSWVPMEFANKLFTLTAQYRYPDLPQNEQLQNIGIDLAKSGFTRIYRIALKLLTPKLIIKKAASLWRTYHSGGTGTVVYESPENFTFEVLDYPDLPEIFAQATSGYIIGIIELTGAKHCQVTKLKEASKWIWHIQYES
jgi:hypothetical protein